MLRSTLSRSGTRVLGVMTADVAGRRTTRAARGRLMVALAESTAGVAVLTLAWTAP